jgi:catechol 2,3-dioxygenase-like lactoylglutathione lyase family enzyme
MSAKIRHLALYTESQDRMATFYQKVFGMKRITKSFNDPNKGHISDGVIGLAVLNRRPGFAAALDHFGFEVDDVGGILELMKQKYPKTLVTKGLEQVAFAVFRSHDPAGTQFDISWKEHPKVQQGYKEDGWEQLRQINHIAIRAAEPEQVAEFYHEVFGLKEGQNFRDEDTLCVTDGTVDLVIRRTTNHSYMSMRQGLDHFGFAVESLEKTKQDLAELATSFPQAAPKDIAGGVFGHITKADMDGCRVGQYSLSDPDGIVLDLSEREAAQPAHAPAG